MIYLFNCRYPGGQRWIVTFDFHLDGSNQSTIKKSWHDYWFSCIRPMGRPCFHDNVFGCNSSPLSTRLMYTLRWIWNIFQSAMCRQLIEKSFVCYIEFLTLSIGLLFDIDSVIWVVQSSFILTPSYWFWQKFDKEIIDFSVRLKAVSDGFYK